MELPRSLISSDRSLFLFLSLSPSQRPLFLFTFFCFKETVTLKKIEKEKTFTPRGKGKKES